MKPLLKWVGGKRALLPELEKLLPNMDEIETYIEPFVGGGSMFFHVRDTQHTMCHVLCDTNKRLINLYRNIKRIPDDVIYNHRNLVEHYRSLTTEGERRDLYLTIRDMFSETEGSLNAAQLLFLNKTCFNGLYRVNKDGHFNTSFGRYENPSFVDDEDILAASKRLNNSVLMDTDFETTVCLADDKTFVYIDPPYIPVRDEGLREYYTAEGFTEQDHKRVADMLKEFDRRGSKFILSMSDTPLAREIYSGWRTYEVEAPRKVAAKPSSRGSAKEIVVLNYIRGL